MTGSSPNRRMAIGPELSGRRFLARMAGLEAWSTTVWLGARRRLATRWMPLSAAAAVFALLVISRQIDALPALLSMVALLAAAAFWPLDTSVLIEALAGADRLARADQSPDLDHKGWRAVIDALPTAALALDAAGTVVHHNRLVAELFPASGTGSR